jgi:hypothetical protein
MRVIKVGISACTGFDYPEGTLSRIIGYKVLEDLRPDSTVLICLPALAAGVEEDIEFGQNYPSIVIEGCGKKCCTRVFEGQKVADNIKRTYDIAELLKAHPEIKLDPAALLNSKPQFDKNLEKFMNQIAEQIAQDIDKLLAEGK